MTWARAQESMKDESLILELKVRDHIQPSAHSQFLYLKSTFLTINELIHESSRLEAKQNHFFLTTGLNIIHQI